MGQIVKRKKKGRPSKADLARRAVGPAPLDEQEIRRSRRRRNVRYDVDYDDYLDEEEDDDLDAEENAKRREKKLKLVLKLPNEKTARQDHALEPEASVSANEYGNHRRTKRRKMDDGDVDEDIDEIDKADEEGYDGTDEERGRKLDAKFHGSVPGTPAGSPLKIPMRDRKTLELILDTLQKKDIYGVYAEPVDPEELPDYHDVIEHPMDFSTVRKKLTNGLYSTLEQFESDVFLICTNAMQYNSEDTIYYKQARSIQELARKRFQKLRDDFERELKSERKASEKELNLEHNTDERDFRSEQKTSSNPLTKKQTKKSNCWTSQEPVGSDFSSGATLATAGDAQNGLNSIHAGNSEKHGNIDMSVEGGFTLTDGNIEKTEDLLLGRGLFLKYGKKSYTVDENRRSTYNLSSQLVLRPESIFTTFECESKQLVAVGLHAEYSYARSVARFAATLGPLAWKVASKRIEQALPAGFKFGHGWVGEYEPLPSPVLLLQSRAEKEQSPLTKPPASTDPIKDGRNSNALFSPNVLLPNGTTSEGILPSWVSSASGANTPERKLSLFSATENKLGPVNNIYQQPNPLLKTGSESYHKVSRQVELNRPPSADQHIVDRVAENQASKKSEMVGPGQVRRGLEMQSPGQLGTVWRNGHNLPFRKPDSNGLVVGGLPNGKVDFDGGRLVTSLSDSVTQVPDHCLSDPVKLMRVLSEKAQRQQNSSPSSPIDAPPSTPSVPLSNNAAAAAARAWMSVGAGNLSVQRNPISAESLYNPAREQLHSRFRGEAPIPGVPHFHADKKRFPGPQSFPSPNGPQVQNRPTMFPQFVAGDFSRFQAQSPWQVLGPQTQLKPKQDSFPPDLNIGFPPSGSPGRRVDNSQQPDLALQL